ncbi:Probable ABC transporter permease protein HI_1471 [Dermatophilus congolensis]|uniref:Probable ABC transporter permease protein HI_1471 n=1 Tax=Dermatophilus congolensis TaxID=1863 RepID=A0AA46BPS1_9MICO|nr:iron ABC transporter permease [Dermatophilus congolensis]STD14072.1 Probable ABC transporter permease protein HI_1471 [Dermatophilus congolensis]
MDTHTCRAKPSHSRRLPAFWTGFALLIALIISAICSLGFGAEPLPLPTVVDAIANGPVTSTDPASLIVWELRLPRAILAIAAGAGLAIAGTAIQTLVRNPLADPYLLGISSGASVGATAVIALGFAAWAGNWALTVGALAGALAAALLVFGVAQAQGGLTPLRLILTGTVLSSAFSSLASFLVFWAADPQATNSVLFWLLGSLSGATWDNVWIPVIAAILAALAALGLSGWLDALAAGDDTAAALGVPVRGLRICLFVSQALLVGLIVAVVGGIGFVGLIVPHIARLLVGGRHRAVIPVAALAGAVFLVWVDVLSRVAVRPVELPLSVLTGLIGAPVFLFLLGRKSYRFGDSR